MDTPDWEVWYSRNYLNGVTYELAAVDLGGHAPYVGAGPFSGKLTQRTESLSFPSYHLPGLKEEQPATTITTTVESLVFSGNVRFAQVANMPPNLPSFLSSAVPLVIELGPSAQGFGPLAWSASLDGTSASYVGLISFIPSLPNLNTTLILRIDTSSPVPVRGLVSLIMTTSTWRS